jgi:formate-dependent nitrite reductase membrane component NrfD
LIFAARQAIYIATLVALFGSKEDRVIARTGYYLALLMLLPCPPLLIKDLGRPERFLHMMRMFKVMSPMLIGVRMWRLNQLVRTSSLLSPMQYLAAEHVVYPSILSGFGFWVVGDFSERQPA